MSFYDNIGYREDGYVRPAQEAFDEMCRLLPNPNDCFSLAKAQMALILPLLPKSRGNKRVGRSAGAERDYPCADDGS